MKNPSAISKELGRTLYKAFGAAVVWELERRWHVVGAGNLAVSLFNDLGGKALTDTSYVKQFGRWKQWYSDDSSFASGSPDVVVDVIGWCRYRSLITRVEEKKLREALLATLLFAKGSSSLERFLEALPRTELTLRQFIEIERMANTKTMFVDQREIRRFRRSELTANAPRGVRLTEDAKRWKAIEAAVVSIESIEKLKRIGEAVKRLAGNWTLSKKVAGCLHAETSRITEQLFGALYSSPLSTIQISAQFRKTIDDLASYMISQFNELQDVENAKEVVRVSKFENKTYAPNL